MEEDEKVTQQLGEKPDASEQAYAPTKEDTSNEAQVDEAATASNRTGEASELVTEQGDQTGEPNDDVAAAPTVEDASEDEQPEAKASAQTAESAKVVCPKCGAEIDAAALYCPSAEPSWRAQPSPRRSKASSPRRPSRSTASRHFRSPRSPRRRMPRHGLPRTRSLQPSRPLSS